MNQGATEIDCSLKSSSYDFGIGIQANAKQGVARQGGGAKLIEVSDDYQLIVMVRRIPVHREHFLRLPTARFRASQLRVASP